MLLHTYKSCSYKEDSSSCIYRGQILTLNETTTETKVWVCVFSPVAHCSGLPFPFPGDLPDPGIEPRSHVLQIDSLLSELPGRYSIGKKWLGGITLSWKINVICQPSNILFHHHFWVILSKWKLPAILVDRNTSSGLWSLTWVNSITPHLKDQGLACLTGAPSSVRVIYGY